MKNKVIVPIMSLFLIGCEGGEGETESSTSAISESSSEVARVCGNGTIEADEECEILEDNCNNCILDRRIFVTNDEFGGLSTYKVIVDDYCDILAKKNRISRKI